MAEAPDEVGRISIREAVAHEELKHTFHASGGDVCRGREVQNMNTTERINKTS